MAAERRVPTYQIEPVWLRDAIWAQGHITPWQLLQICAWKSAKGLAPLSVNQEVKIEEHTSAALDSLRWAKDLDVLTDAVDWNQWEESVRWAIGSAAAGSGLLGLSGVGYPVATAILCILNPRAFPVLDRWAIADVYGPDAERPRHYFGATKYRDFTERLVDHHVSGSPETIHDLDKAAMKRTMEPRA